MKTKIVPRFLIAIILFFLFTSVLRAQVPASYLCSLRNDSLTSSTTYEFDIFMLNTDPANVFEYDLFQAGILLNPAIVNGGTITASIVSGSSQLVTAQQPGSITFTASQNCIKLGPGGITPHGSATIISTTSPGTRIARIRLTNTLPFGQSSPNFTFNFTASPYNTVVTAYNQTTPFLGVNITNAADHTTLPLINPILNSPVIAYNMTGGGFYCSGAPGIVIGLTSSQSGVRYQLLQNSVPFGPLVPGTGAALSFGYVPAGTYTVIGYRAGTYLSGTMSGNSVVVLNTGSPVSVTISAGGNPSCSGSPVTFTATPVNGGIVPAYQWQVNNGNAGTNSSSFTYNPSNNDVVKCILTSSIACPLGNPATSNAITMSVITSIPLSVSISAGANPVCSGTPVTFTAIPVNAGTTPSFQWKVNGVNAGTNNAAFTYTPVNNDVVSCYLTSSLTCATPATSNPVTMIVNPNLPVSVSIAAQQNPICSGTQDVFTATPVNGGPSPSYQWKVNGVNSGNNSSTFTYIPANNDIVTCVLTSNTACSTGNPATSNALTISVVSLLNVSVSIATSTNPVCAGTPVTFTATPVNGGSLPSYQWKVNGQNSGTNNAIFTYTPVNNDMVSCVLTSDATCAAGSPALSNTVTMTVNPILPVSITIAASMNPACMGFPVTFTATPVNQGTIPVYQWKVNGNNVGTNSPVYTYNPANTDAVSCILTSNATCETGSPATSNVITMTENINLPVSVSIAIASYPVCSGSPVTLTATPTFGGTNPSYQWMVNGVNTGTNAASLTYVPTNHDVVKCVMTSSALCTTGNPATSNSITLNVTQSLPASIVITATQNPACVGSYVTFRATPTNGGLYPAYQWQVNGVNVGNGLSSYTYRPANNDVVTCILTSDLPCVTGSPVTSNAITMTVTTPQPVSVSIAASQNPVCTGSPVTFTATPVNGGTYPDYEWDVNGMDAGTYTATFTYIPANNDVVTCYLYSNAGCVTGNPATSNAVTMVVGNNIPVSIAIVASANPVCAGSTVTITTNPTNGGTHPKYTWYKNNIPIPFTNVFLTSSYTYTPVNGDKIYVVMVSNGSCATTSPAFSNMITMAVTPLVGNAGPISGPSTFVPGHSGVSYSVAPIANATSYTWLYSGTGVTINGTGPSVTLNFATNATGGTLWVRGHNSCGDGMQSILVITRASSMPTPPPGTTTLTDNGRNDNILDISPEVTIFPNPVEDNLNIRSTADINTVQILNLMGQVVRSSNVGTKSSVFNISGLESGVYYVRVLMNDGYILTRKVIVRNY